jgi:lysophospholipase L1-like esterase
MVWYEDEVKRIETEGKLLPYQAETIFYGSSSIRMWASLYDDFKDLKPVNLGFGGSTLEACVWFFERVMQPYQPKRMVFYAGDNDLGDGRNPEEVFIFFKQLVVKAEQYFGDIPCYFISLKPSLARWPLLEKFKYTNSLIATQITSRQNNWHFIDVFTDMIDASGNLKRDLFLDDGLHLSYAGYVLWKKKVSEQIAANG